MFLLEKNYINYSLEKINIHLIKLENSMSVACNCDEILKIAIDYDYLNYQLSILNTTLDKTPLIARVQALNKTLNELGATQRSTVLEVLAKLDESSLNEDKINLQELSIAIKR